MVEGSPHSSKRESGARDYGWRVKVHMPILRTEAVRGERVNAELSRANQVPWDMRLSVVPSRTHAQGAIECDVNHTNSRMRS